ncbi:hypothetical protein NDU88_006526 [Pleurodeles waltl]|uniref:Uncharacterized protein n=1 Tax=Pleurodeles waltl TaxID=8319 RepID=A0AAV7TXW2_PLEWA|nr:hypothetical protein NDU88_006526 [Pleurodeles waltl]
MQAALGVIVGVTHLSEQIQGLEHRAEDAEGRSRYINVRIVGMPESVEGPDAVTYLESWLCTLDERPLTPFFALERAHRVPTRRSEPGGRPPNSGKTPSLPGLRPAAAETPRSGPIPGGRRQSHLIS